MSKEINSTINITDSLKIKTNKKRNKQIGKEDKKSITKCCYEKPL